MKHYHFLLLFSLLTCQGCVSYLSKDLRQVTYPKGQNGAENIVLLTNIQTAKNLSTKEKNKLLKRWKPFVSKTYQGSGYFAEVRESSTNAKQAEVTIKLYPLKNKGVRGVWLFASSLSFYTIPFYMKPEIILETVFKDKSGNVLGIIEKKGRLNTWAHILFLPTLPFAELGKVSGKAIEKLTLQTLEEAKQKGWI